MAVRAPTGVLGEGTHDDVGLQHPEHRTLEVMGSQVTRDVVCQSRPDALLPTLGRDEERVDLTGAGVEVVIAGDAAVRETDDELVVERDPGLAVGRLQLELLAPELLAAERGLAGEVLAGNQLLVSALPSVDVDLRDAGSVRGRGSAVVDGAFAWHVTFPQGGSPHHRTTWRRGQGPSDLRLQGACAGSVVTA